MLHRAQWGISSVRPPLRLFQGCSLGLDVSVSRRSPDAFSQPIWTQRLGLVIMVKSFTKCVSHAFCLVVYNGGSGDDITHLAFLKLFNEYPVSTGTLIGLRTNTGWRMTSCWAAWCNRLCSLWLYAEGTEPLCTQTVQFWFGLRMPLFKRLNVYT